MKSTVLPAILFLLAPIAESKDEIWSGARAIDEDALVRQQAALERIPDVNVRYDESGIPNRIEGNPVGIYRSKPEALRAVDLRNLMDDLGPVFLATGSETWVERTGTMIPDGLGIIYRLDQYIDGRRVVGGELVLRTDAMTHHVVTVDARFLPDRGLPHEAIVSSDDAVARVFEYLEGRHGVENISFTIDEGPELLYLFDSERRSSLAWRLVVLYSTPDQQSGHDEVYVDSQDGAILKIRRMRNAALNRKTYTLNFTLAAFLDATHSTVQVA